MGSLKFSQQYGNNKISVNQNQKVVTIPVGVVEPGDKHFIGVVQEITEEKFICSASELSDLIECIKGCNAEVGDEVIICLMQDGQYVVVARVGGDLGGGEIGGGGTVEDVTNYIAGRVFAHAGMNDPAGALLCDGRAVSRSDYWELFNAIGTMYGAGDGTSTFNLPNIESRTIIGESDSYALGTTGGEEKHTLTKEEMPKHAHYLHQHNNDDGTMTAWVGNAQNLKVVKSMENIYNAGEDQPHNNMQPYIVMRYFITTGKADPASGINPADYVVEWGVTGIWTWRKYASGLAECWGSQSFSPSAEPWQSHYMSSTSVDLPFEFTEILDARADVTANGSNIVFGSIATISNTTIRYHHSSMNDIISGTSRLYVLGKWKDSPASGGTETIAPTIAEKFEGIESDILDMRTNKILWSGAYYLSGDQTATLSEAISEQAHGIVLVFSLYEPSSSTVKDTDWSYHFIPKHHTMKHNEEGLAVSSLSQWLHMAKYFYVGDTVIRGNGNNGKNSTTVGNVTISNGSYVLRYVLGV